MSSFTKIEFAVQMKCNSCANAIKKHLSNNPEIRNVDIDLNTGSVVVDTTLSTTNLLEKIEETGKRAVVKGFECTLCGVVILEVGLENVKGVIRFIQTQQVCIIDGTIDGFKPGEYLMSIHECGDISDGCNSAGDIFNPKLRPDNSKYGDLGIVTADEKGRISFRLEDAFINLSDIIGRSLMISEKDPERALVCGIIARSSGLFQNPKTICACDGISIWDEVSGPKL